MMIRSLSGVDRTSSTSYVVLPPGMPMVATTPARTPCCDKPTTPIAENAILTTGLISSLLIFFMWVGAWGCIDTLVAMSTDVPLHQLMMYAVVLLFASLLLWFELSRIQSTQDVDDSDFRV